MTTRITTIHRCGTRASISCLIYNTCWSPNFPCQIQKLMQYLYWEHVHN